MANETTDTDVQRAYGLMKKRDILFRLPAQKTMELILEDRQPAALVHSFAEQDFYLLIHELGPEESHPLLKLASLKQWEYILDMECWNRDRLAVKPVTRWLNLLLKADPTRLISWFLKEKTEFIQLYLFKSMEIVVRTYDQDPSEIDDRFFTIDDLIYIRLFEDLVLKNSDPEILDLRKAFLRIFIDRLADYDFAIFQKVMLETMHLIPAEYEEDTYRWRNVRLAEKGFVPFEEAVGIYQPLRADETRAGTRHAKRSKTEPRDDLAVFFGSPLAPSQMLEADSLFAGSLQRVSGEEVLQQIQVEFASLCNQIIVADRKTITDREQLAEIVKKACGFLSIGIDALADTGNLSGENRGAAILSKYPVLWIFRAGVGKVFDLKRQAQTWRQRCWFETAGLPLTFWDEDWLGVLGGLLIKRPLYFDNYRSGVIYREFSSLQEIEETRRVLGDITGMDDLLSLFDVYDMKELPKRWLTYKNFLLTAWCRDESNLPLPLEPVPVSVFQKFFEDLFMSHRSFPEAKETSMEMKSRFLNWLAEKSGVDAHEITDRLGAVFESLFEEMDAEYGGVDSKDIDPKYVRLFLIQPVDREER